METEKTINEMTQEIDENIEDSNIDSRVKKNFIKMNESDKNQILQGNLYNIYSNNVKNNKMNQPHSERHNNDSSFIDEMKKIENKIISINTEENENSYIKRKIPKMELKLQNCDKNENPKNLYNNTYNKHF